MNQSHDPLLQPTLSAQSETKPIYSVRSAFLVAFFGGPLAITIYSALNSQRLGRLGKDLPVYLAGIVVLAALIYTGVAHPEWYQSEGDSKSNFRYATRGAGLLLWGAYYLLHAKYSRAMATTGVDHPDPWAAALVTVFASMAIIYGVSYILETSGYVL